MRFIFTTALAMALTTGAHAATFNLDSFDTNQLVQASSLTDASQLADPTTPGGFRDLQALSGSGVASSTEMRVDSGILGFSNISGTAGTGFLTYDGDDAPDSVNTTGLGNLDLTFGGLTNALVFDVVSVDANMPISLNVWDMVGGFSSQSHTSSGAGPGLLSFQFSSFAGDADLSNLGAIQFVFGGNGVAGLNLSLNSIGVTDGTIAPIPVPASGLLLGTILLVGFGASRRRLRGGATR